jgi:hypothetical protein
MYERSISEHVRRIQASGEHDTIVFREAAEALWELVGLGRRIADSLVTIALAADSCAKQQEVSRVERVSGQKEPKKASDDVS